MSADAHINIGFQKVVGNFQIVRVKPLEIIQGLISTGWSLNTAEGRYGRCWTWRSESARERQEFMGKQEDMLEHIAVWQKDDDCVSAGIIWPETGDGGDLYVHQREQMLTLGKPTTGSRWRELPGFEAFTDYNWYVTKLVKAVEAAGAGVYEVKAWYHG